MPSIVAELDMVIEQHPKMIGMLHDPKLSPEERQLIGILAAC